MTRIVGRRATLWLGLLLLGGCGDLPQPFRGNPGAAAARLAAPLPPRLAIPVPTASLLGDRDAALWAKLAATSLDAAEVPAFAEPAKPGDWQLRLTAELSGGGIVPRYTVIDPSGASKGDIAGARVASSAWSAGGEALLAPEVTASTPPLLDLLRSIQAGIARSDPNSLLNRPARLYVVPVVGAPGDGDRALMFGMRRRLPETGDLVVKTAGEADFSVRGTVKLSDAAGGQQIVEIHWHVIDRRGREAGDIAQVHEIPRGSLDGIWGDVASVITDQAADAVHEVIGNVAGRAKGGNGAPGKV